MGQFKRRHYSALKIRRKETAAPRLRQEHEACEKSARQEHFAGEKGVLKMKYTQYTKCFQKSWNRSKGFMKTSIEG